MKAMLKEDVLDDLLPERRKQKEEEEKSEKEPELKSKSKKKKKSFKKKYNLKKVILISAIIIVIIALGISGTILYWPINVTVNDTNCTLTFNKTLRQAIVQTNTDAYPGNFIAVDNSILIKGSGEGPSLTVNESKDINWDTILKDGDQIKYENGADIMEDYYTEDTTIKATVTIKGRGAIHKLTGTGEDGIHSKMFGKISFKTAEKDSKPASNIICKEYDIIPEKDKLVALTFDDGPSEQYTSQILDILKSNDAKATFFTIGEQIETSWGKKIIEKEDQDGHQICTHTYDHGRAMGGTTIVGMTKEQQINEITKGQDAIKKVINNETEICRLPGGNLDENTLRNIGSHIKAEIGWNVDTKDWAKPGKDAILKALSKVQNGDVILCHDGGGDRSQTIEALKEFIPKLKEQGYKFVTIDDLMTYQEAKQPKESSLQNSTHKETNQNDDKETK